MLRLHHWLRNENRDPPSSLGIWSDIFDNIHRLQRLNREQDAQNLAVIREFESMTDAFPDATLVIDNNNSINWFNDSARRLLGLRTPEDVGQPVTNLLRDPDFADWLEVQDKVESQFEMSSPGDSNAQLSVSAVRHRDNHRLLILRDVTDLYNLERVRRDFVANVSHELRTPLTVLFGYLESLQDNCPEDIAPAIDRMHEQARQMQALLSDLLELSRLQAAEDWEQEKVIDVCAILMQLKEQAEEISQGTHQIEVDCASGAKLRGSDKDIESAFRNLISNAIYYTPADGTVRISWQQSQEGSVFSVSDTGIGIPRKDIPRLTERFYRVGSDRSRHTGGTGLGLAIVKHVLNAHDARLVIDSELGEGSTFSCIFPRQNH
jgi:two-component system phosphate regulon sensor histidine kinase PhoR